MRVVVWITERSWRDCVDHARAVVRGDDTVALLYVSAADVEGLATSAHHGLLGRPARRDPGPPIRVLAEAGATDLLAAARARLGRHAELIVRHGHVEREVIEACAGADLLLLARDGDRRPGPKSLGRFTRFVVDHAPCTVQLVWTGEPPGLESIHWPPHLRGDRAPR